MRTIGILLLFLVVVPYSCLGTHLVGGELYYDCLGNNEYRITLKVYRDCLNGQAPFDAPASIGIFNSNGGLVQNIQVTFDVTDNVPLVIDNPCLQVPPDLCVDYAIYSTTVTLPPIPGGYHIAYQRCCRNETIINLVDPGAQGTTNYLQITESVLGLCNSSPRFSDLPPIAICRGEPLVFDHSATDPDGDLLVYSLCTPFHGADDITPMPSPPSAPPYDLLNWLAPYSATYPIASNPAFTLDPVTGMLTGTPNQLGQFVVGVCVEEFRNGVLLGTSRRDFQFNVVNCSSNVQAVIPPQFTFNNPCDGLTLPFDNGSINSTYFHWDFGVNGIATDTSDEQFPTYTYPDSGTYTVLLIANPGYPCADTTVGTFNVQHLIIADIPFSGDACFDVNSFDFVAGGDYLPNATFQWDFGPTADPPNSTQQNPSGVSFSNPGTNAITLIITVGDCSDSDTTYIETFLRPQLLADLGPHIGCEPLYVQFRDSSEAETQIYYSWDFGDGATSDLAAPHHTYTDSGHFDVSVTIWTTEGCIDTLSLTVDTAVIVLPQPEAVLTVEPDSASIFEPDFNLSLAEADSNITACWLYAADGSLSTSFFPDCDFSHTYSDTGNFIPFMVLWNEFGCSDTIRTELRVIPEHRFWLPNAFTPDGDGLNDTFGPSFMGVREYSFVIYDRWGQQVFSTDEPSEKWDGTVNRGNHIGPSGVYDWYLFMRDFNGNRFRKDGMVVLVR